MKILGIETSCDETAAAICIDGKIVSSKISSQEIHNKFGGVIPELASREHEKMLNFIVHQALKDSKISLEKLDGIAVTQGPGLSGALIVGTSFSKGLAVGLNIPIIGINHLEAHIFANFLAEPGLTFPFTCLLVSGGHTQLWLVNDFGKYDLFGETRDDAAGEAFDKGARILGLGYPGGPEIEKLATKGNHKAIEFPKALIEKNNFECSFIGLKTSLLYYIEKNEKENINDIAASYQYAIIDVLVKKLKYAAEFSNSTNCVIAGGVAANKFLREHSKNQILNRNIIFPHPSFCTDNAAMIAFLGEKYFIKGNNSNLDFSILPNMRLS
ncbi:MAG: tRNA (adenosine(37)-N6)-threonylcarbamoyltransferase complex transferase subunit TsaD [Candidatus Neomarinimicrobiota bacterium]|nr:tRNA (adenosine(37)-N6)-threonylcarbamoyltransferase complex transferase subunit TsaD [Candidatus Neomarinimicrobiota bacterium]